MKIVALSQDKITEALLQLEQVVLASGNQNDLTYFHFHKYRYKTMAQTISSTCKPGSLILDIGSHFLHSSVLLTMLGFRVHAVDVQEFWDIEFVKQRAAQYSLTPITENNLGNVSSSCFDNTDTYDVVLFTEILEHITFNPIAFWKTVHSTLKHGGIIYITTPNSLTLYNILRTVFNIIRLKGIGLDINSIFDNATYGHHWKEYSSHEIKEYFAKMNKGFSVEIKKYFYKPYPANTLRSQARALVVKAGNLIPYFKDELEAVITVDKSKEWELEAPGY